MRLILQKISSVKKFLFMSFSFLFAMLAINAGMFFNLSNNANAIKYNDTTSYVKVGELFDSSSKTFNAANMRKLVDILGGDSNTSFETIKNLASGATSDSMPGHSALDIRKKTYNKSATQDVVITLGGLTWQVMYLSTDNSADKNVVLTLWLTGDQEAWKDRLATEGDYYGFLRGNSSTTAGMYSTWSAKVSNSSFGINNPTSMYGASYINAVTLNNGGTYVSAVSDDTATATTTLSTATKSANSVFANFTMDTYGLTKYLITPANVPWQLNQSARNELGTDSSYDLPNEASSTISNPSYYTSSMSSMVSNRYYYEWTKNYLWLPSLTETGYGRGRYSNSSSYPYITYDGIWQVSDNQRMNYDGSISNIGLIGPSYLNATPYSWLRTGSHNSASYAADVYPSGSYTSSNSTFFVPVDSISYARAVRPAMHLNLTSAAKNLIEDIEESSPNTVNEIWDDSKKEFKENNLSKLMQFVTGNASISTENLDPLKEMATNGINADQMNRTTVTSSIDDSVKQAGKDIIVQMGGLNWTPVYLSTSDEGKPILTLWLENSEQLNGKKFYKSNFASDFFNANGTTTWNSGFAPSTNYEYNGAKPDDMYGLSAIRATVLNNSGTYSTQTRGATTAEMTSIKSDSVFSPFTYTTNSYRTIADCIVTPNCVPWQKAGQDAREILGHTYKYPNEDLQLNQPDTGYDSYFRSGYGTFYKNYSNKTNYDAWGTDKLWLPSLSETGYSNDRSGIWGTSVNQRANTTATWVRSAHFTGSYTYYLSLIDSNGSSALTGNSSSTNKTYINNNYAVRPALHLDLSKASGEIDKTDLETCTADAIPAGQWNPVRNEIPRVSIRNNIGENLVEGTDYTVTTDPATITTPGEVTLTLTGKGAYMGTKILKYTLNSRDIKLALRDNTLSPLNQFYTGSALRPTLTGLKDYAYETLTSSNKLSAGGITLTQGVDYTLEYSNNINAGAAVITIKGMGKYGGTTTVNFAIVSPDAISPRLWNPVRNDVPEIIIRNTVKGTTLIKGTDYTVTASTISGPGTVTLTITGMGQYAGSTSATYNLTQRDIGVALRDNNLNLDVQFYTGSPITPAITGLKDYAYESASSSTPLSSSGINLIQGTDYTLEYSNNVSIGTATITIRGAGKYSGVTTTAFTISTPSISSGRITLNNPNVEYNFGEDVSSKIVPTVVAGSKTMVLGTDYTIAYYDNSGAINLSEITAVGSYIIRATGKGNYSGSLDARFTVEPHTLKNTYLTVGSVSPIYDGSAKITEIIVEATYTHNSTSKKYSFTKNTDYSVSFDNNINASNLAEVTITGVGNFRGTATKNFTIRPKSIAGDDISTSNIATQVYTGSAITPSVVVRDVVLSKTLTAGVDYNVAYNNNINYGQASVVISGMGNYDSSTRKTIPFVIVQKDITSATINTIPDQTYTGSNIEPNLTIIDSGKTLTRNTDYTAIFLNNMEVGTATVRIDGKGNYTGTKTTVFTITKASLNSAGTRVILSPSSSVYTGRSIIPTISVTTIPPGTATSIFVASFNYDVTVLRDGEELKNGFDDLIEVGAYTIRINGKNNYEGSAQETFVVTKANMNNITASLSTSTFEYNGTPQTPTETLIFNGKALQRGVDYELEYRQSSVSGLTVYTPVNANKYFLVITGKGNFEGSNTKLSFDIVPARLSGDVTTVFTTNGTDEITESSFNRLSYIFDNSTKKVDVKSVKIGGIEFYSGTDFLDVAHLRDNRNTTDFTSAGTITIKISSLSDNVQGDKTYTYTIARRSLQDNSGLEITGLTDATYDRQAHNTHTITLRDSGANNYQLTENDYTISYPTDCTSANPAVKVSFIATSSGNYEGKVESSFAIAKASIDSFDISSSSGKYNAQPHTFSSTVTAGTLTLNTTEYILKYTRNGVETTDLTSVGTITVTLTLPTVSNFEISNLIQPRTYSITNIEIVSVTLVKTNQVFDNANHELVIASVMGDNNTVLPASDYDVRWRYNTNSTVNPDEANKYYAKNVGTYSLTVSGKGNVTGQATAEFTITAREITSGVITYYNVNPDGSFIIKDGEKVKVELETDYRGQRVKPEISMILPGGEYTLEISPDSGSGNPKGDFTFGVYNIGAEITPGNNILQTSNYLSVGEYNFVITGINNFSGVIQKTYRVNLAQFNQEDIIIEILKDREDLIYTGNPITFNFDRYNEETKQPIVYNEVKVIHRDTKLESGVTTDEPLYLGKHFELFTGYIRVTLNSENQITAAVIVDESNKDEENVLYIDGGYVNNNSVGQAAFVLRSKEGSPFVINSVVIHRFEITKIILTDKNTSVGVEEEYTYTGSAVVNPADVEVIKDTTTRLEYNKDYELTLSQDTNAGVVTITVRGINTYEGEFTKTFTILPKSLEDSMFTVSENKVYNGNKQMPTITGVFNEIGLQLNTDYSLSYSSSTGETPDFIKADTITITITGNSNGNFTGEVTKTFTIEKQTIKEIVLSSTQATFTGSEHTFTATVNDALGNLVKQEEYSLIYSREDRISAGTIRVSVMVESSSNYKITAEVFANFVINKAPLSQTTGTVEDVVYSGYVNRPNIDDIQLKLGLHTLDAGEYEIEDVLNSINVSTEETKATVVLRATNKNFEGRKEIEFNVIAKSIETINAGSYQQEFAYNGQSQSPVFNLTYSSILVLGRDYEVKIERTSGENDADSTKYINVGTFNVIITGIGNFTGSLIKTYSITKRNLASEDSVVDITFEKANHIYTGESIEPTITSVTITINGTKITLNSADYSVAYTDCINAGNGTVTLTGIGNFTGSTSKTFTIAQAQLDTNTLNIEIQKKSYTGTRIYLNEDDIHIYNKVAEGNGTEITNANYDISYISPPVNVGRYTITIRGKGNYKGTIQAQFEVIPISLEDAEISYEGGEDIFVTAYTGSDLRQNLINNIIVKIGEISLQYAVHYTIAFSSENLQDTRYLIDVGEKEFTIQPRTGNNNITGSKDSQFTVISRSLEDCELNLITKKYTYTGEDIEPEYMLTYNGIPLREGIDYSILYNGDHRNCGNVSCTIIAPTTDGMNFEGSLSLEFTIEQATPVVELRDKNQTFFAGDAISIEAFGLEAKVGDKDIEGTLRLTNTNTILSLGENVVRYTFTPKDSVNYKTVSDTLRVYAVNYVRVTFTYNRGEVANVVAGNNTRIDVRVELRRGTSYSLLTKGVDYTETIILTDTNEEVSNFSLAGRYEISVEMLDPVNFVIQTESNISFYAKSKTLYAKNAPFYATSKDYFEEGMELIVETYESKRDIVGIIGAENYDSISNIGKVYRVVGLFKNNEEQTLEGITIYFETTTSDFYTYGDNGMSSAYHNRTNVEVEVGVFLIESERESNMITIIIIVAAVVVVLAVLIIVTVKVVGNRKFKKASAGAKVDLEKLNQIANSASSARATGTTPNIQAIMNATPQQPPKPPQPNMAPPQQQPNGVPPQQPNMPPRPPMPNQPNGMPPQMPPQNNPQMQGQPPRPMGPQPMGNNPQMPPRPPQPMGMPPQQPPMQNGPRPPQPPQNNGGNPPPPINR